MGISDPDKRVEAFSKLLEQRPGAWMIIGLAIIFLSTGSINLQLGELELTIGDTESITLRAIILMTGLFLFVIGVHLIIDKKTNYKNTLVVILSIVYLSIVIIIFVNDVYKSTSKTYISEWTYSSGEKMYSIKLLAEALQEFKGSELVMIARNGTSQDDFREDKNIQISPPFPVPARNAPNTLRSLKCDSLANSLTPGDMLEIHLLVIPKNTNLSQMSTISDFLSIGGRHLDWKTMSIDPDFSELRHVTLFYGQLKDNEKNNIRAVACP